MVLDLLLGIFLKKFAKPVGKVTKSRGRVVKLATLNVDTCVYKQFCRHYIIFAYYIHNEHTPRLYFTLNCSSVCVHYSGIPYGGFISSLNSQTLQQQDLRAPHSQTPIMNTTFSWQVVSITLVVNVPFYYWHQQRGWGSSRIHDDYSYLCSRLLLAL